jgi:hypothetical protein
LSVYFSAVSKAIWLFLFIFWGLPLTLKFFIELWVLLALFSAGSTSLFAFVIFILFLANVFVTKVWLQMLYGSSPEKNYQSDLSSWELLTVVYLVLMNTAASLSFTYVFF